MNTRFGRSIGLVWVWAILGGLVVTPALGEQAPATASAQRQASRSGTASGRAPQSREARLCAVVESLGVGEGSVIADIGAGRGRDTWVFAEITGPEGTVFAEEIGEDDVDRIREDAQRRGLPQVEPVLGRVDSPGLPDAVVDLAYMHNVYHHVTHPREMLQGIWRALKPGGYFVVVDRRRGTLQDWVPREERGPKHFWIAETTVVREAREEGFEFVRFAEDLWPDGEQFVLIFQRPEDLDSPGTDPGQPEPLDLEQLAAQLRPENVVYERPVFVALGESRKLLAEIVPHSRNPGVDVVLEEWATRKDERPPLPEGLELPSTCTDNGDPHLGEKPVDVVFFLDTYHLLFHHETLLAKIRERLTPQGRVFVLDRRAKQPMPHREASHRRRIPPELVRGEMARAGFELAEQLPPPAEDRFLWVFVKSSDEVDTTQ